MPRFPIVPQALGTSGSSGPGMLFGIRFHSTQRALLEAVVWTFGLIAVGSADPTLPSAIDLCLFKAVGLPGCPGCGLGHAMGYLFRGEWLLAIESHWFSPVVLVVLVTRIFSLIRQAFAGRPTF